MYELFREQTTFYTPALIAENVQMYRDAITESGYQGGYYIFAADGNNLGDKNSVLLYRSPGTDSYWDTIQPSQLQEGKKYTCIFIIFDSSFGPSQKMVFHPSCYMDCGNGTALLNGHNSTTVASGEATVSTNAYMRYTPVCRKYDARYSAGGAFTEHIQSDLYDTQTGKYLLQWGIEVNLPADEDYTSDVEIVETLPEGTLLSMNQYMNSML